MTLENGTERNTERSRLLAMEEAHEEDLLVDLFAPDALGAPVTPPPAGEKEDDVTHFGTLIAPVVSAIVDTFSESAASSN